MADLPVSSANDKRDGLESRRFAVKLFDSVVRRRQPFDDELQALQAQASFAALSPGDRALTRAIVTTALRHLGHLRLLVADRLRRGIPERSGPFETIMLIGMTQILYLDIPDHAAVDTTISLMREDRYADRYANLANAALRRLVERRDTLLAGLDPLANAPDWLRERWVAQYGAQTAAAIIRMQGREPTLDISVKSDVAAWAERLNGLVIGETSLRLRDHTPIPLLDGFAEGAWWVQDAAAAIPARLLDAKPGQRLLDLCAAPGGKTAQLAASGATVVAVDRSAQRMKRLSENLARLKLEAETVISDALDYQAAPFDAVLLDAPCTATGTIRRHPDVAWTKSAADIAKLAALQTRLLAHAATLVKPGGLLIYATCSLEQEEGEAQIARFLAETPGFRRVPITEEELGGLAESRDAQGDFRALPCHLAHEESRLSGVDGFFAARVQRYT